MRTQKRFTPSLLQRFDRQGRGLGTFQDYVPWHRVGRGDPASEGRSHLMCWKGRQREMLSDGEWDCLAFATMLNDLLDAREQHNLSLEAGPHELALYDVSSSHSAYPGTVEIAERLGYKHPCLSEDGTSELWRMTTDQLLVLKPLAGFVELLAIGYKPDRKTLTKRKRQLLEIEMAYWHARGVTWLLITPDLFEESVGLTLRRTAPWGLGIPTTEEQRQVASQIVTLTLGHTFTFTLNEIKGALGSMELAQCALWQAVWNGDICMDLRVGWRPHLPIEILSTEDFRALNPVLSRKTSWN